MSYRYEDQRPYVLTDGGQRVLLTMRDKAERCIKLGGAVRSLELMSVGGGGDTWQLMACVDRLVELNYLQEITDDKVAGQHRVFTAGSAWR
jgi:hypothetical protein